MYVCVHTSAGSAPADHSAQLLHNTLFENYTRNVRPRSDYSETVEVEIDFVLNSINGIVRYTRGLGDMARVDDSSHVAHVQIDI